MLVTVLILTRNSEETIAQCIESVRFAGEVLVVDDGSTDGTQKIARDMKATVINRSLKNNFAAQRSWGTIQSKYEWVLHVDSDEEVTPELAKEIQDLTEENTEGVSGYMIRRRDFWMGKELRFGETSAARDRGFIRLIRRGKGEWKKAVHEEWDPTKGTRLRSLVGFLNHYPHQTVTEFLQEINRYSSIRAKELYEEKTPKSIAKVIIYPFGKFLFTYFLKGGFRDGAPGFVYSFMMAFHSFLVRAKLYQYYFDAS